MKHILKYSQFLNEGIKMGQHGQPEIDFSADSPEDLIKLQDAPEAGVTRSTIKANKIPMYYGYVMQDGEAEKKSELMDALKRQDSISDGELTQLVKETFPRDLINKRIEFVIAAGSSSPLAMRIASTIQKLFYPKAKVADVLKRFYYSPLDIVNWPAYMKADKITREQFDSYLKNHVASYWNGKEAMAWAEKTGLPIDQWPGSEDFSKAAPSQSNFTGYVKKSSGLRSGSRILLNPGHHIDDLIVNTIRDSKKAYQQLAEDPRYRKDFRMLLINTPNFLIVDDMILGGTTLRGIVSALATRLAEVGLADQTKNVSTYSLIKYGETRKYEPKKVSPDDKAMVKKADDTMYIKYLTMFRDADKFAKSINRDVTQIIAKLADSENKRELSKPEDSRVEYTVDKVMGAAKKAGLVK
jgi:hypothetical protein